MTANPGHYLGIEIGGTKLQLGIGPDDGKLRGLWRATVDVQAGAEGIRRQIQQAIPELLNAAGLQRSDLRGIGIGFGGPTDDATQTVIRSHQITGWDNFPLGDWAREVIGLPTVLGNDADVAGLAEAIHGAGKGMSPIFYITIGSGIGGGLIINEEIYRGVGRGAAEIGHLRMDLRKEELGIHLTPLEKVASGWGLASVAKSLLKSWNDPTLLHADDLSAQTIAEAATRGDALAREVLHLGQQALAEAICHIIALLCPRRIVIGGGVSLMGEELLFEPLRNRVNELVFAPFAGLTEIVPAELGEEMVVHGAIAMARRKGR